MGDFSEYVWKPMFTPIFNYSTYGDKIEFPRKLPKLEKEEKEEMKKCVVDNYPVTEDAVLVEKHWYTMGLGDDTFITGLLVQDYKDVILAEAKRLEEEAKKAKEKQG